MYLHLNLEPAEWERMKQVYADRASLVVDEVETFATNNAPGSNTVVHLSPASTACAALFAAREGDSRCLEMLDTLSCDALDSFKAAVRKAYADKRRELAEERARR